MRNYENIYKNDTDDKISKDMKTVVITIIHIAIIHMLKKIKESMSPVRFFIEIYF